MFTPEDIKQLEAHGITLAQAEQQMLDFKNGFPALDIVGPASVKDGIMKLTKAQQDEYIALWQEYQPYVQEPV